MIYGSVCSGIEAASVAWAELDWRAAFFSEIEEFPRAVLRARHRGVPIHGDFTTIGENDYEPIDILVGGTPCQDFSVAGLRAGLTGKRGGLTIEFARLAQRLCPRWLVWENVPGVLSIDSGRAFGAFLGLLGECGYGIAYRILDAQHFGVPQRRRRVFVVGYLGDWRPSAAVLFERESLRWDSPPRREAGKGVARPVTSCPKGGSGYRNDADTADNLIAFDWRASPSQSMNPSPIAPSLSVGRSDGTATLAFGGNRQSGPLDVATAVNAHGGPQWRLDFESEKFVCGTLNANGKAAGSATQQDAESDLLVAHSLRADGFDASEDGTGRGVPLIAFKQGAGSKAGTIGASANLAPTLGAAESGTNSVPAISQSLTVRRLTPRECERLQGLPDDYTRIPARVYPRRPTTKHFHESRDLYEPAFGSLWIRFADDGARYRAIGNSMAIPVMRWLGERITLVERLIRLNASH